MKDTVYIKSDRFFNDPEDNQMYEDMGMDIAPVDLYGAVVPTGKKLSNLSQAQKNIRERFQLDPSDVEQGGEG